ncbi:threonine synthase [Dehalococcoidia bacterium]|nr:threonine synthase [Dehalococcoidia bacterium]
MGAGVLNTYRDLLPITSATPMITMGEGGTPLVKSNRLGRELGCPELYFKLEGCNPTGSFKDRGMVVAIAKALEEGTRAIMCASTGNTSASAAAFGAYCDIPTFVLIPKGEVAMGKLAQAMIYGAKVIMINGNFDAALGLVREFTEKNDVTLVNSVNPHRIEGQKTAAFELVDTLGDAPDLLFIPVGNAGNITAYWKGFREYQDLGRSQTLPRMMGFQAEGAAPIVRGEIVTRPQTIASAIRIGNPATWQGAIDARDGSGGVIDAVSDDEILDAYRALASKEGIFCEPASAASLAGLVKLHRHGLDLQDKRVVCICTGNGLKDPDLAVSSAVVQAVEVPATMEAIEEATLGIGE